MQQKVSQTAMSKAQDLKMPVSMAYAGPSSAKPGSPMCSFGHVAYPWFANKLQDDPQGLHPPGGQCDIEPGHKTDCGFKGITETECLARSCCWFPVPGNTTTTPWCYNKNYIPTPGKDNFLFGSLTKVWTSAALLKLQRENKLNIDEAAWSYMEPAYKNATNGKSLLDVFGSQSSIKDVTIRELMEMRGSLRDYDEIVYQAANPEKDIGPDETVRLFGPGMFMEDLPIGTCGVYSSFSFVLLGLVLNGQSRLKWDEYEQNVWKHKFPRIRFATRGPCSNYTDILGECQECGNQSVSHMSCTGGYTSGNMVAPAEEVARFARSLFSGDLLGSDLTNEMLTYQKLGPDGASGNSSSSSSCKSNYTGDYYGLGVEAHKVKERPGHEGIAYGFTTQTMYDMKTKGAYVVAIPSSRPGMDALTADAWTALRMAVGPYGDDEMLFV
jgi:CubicO group peptidase (beta-lactamase class C family)